MSFFTQFASAVANNLVNSFTSSGANDLLKVIEASSSTYVSRSVFKREHCLVMYGPGIGNDGYDLVLVLLLADGNKEKVYSLCRSSDSGLVDRQFKIAKEILPSLSRISVKLCLLPRLQDLWYLVTDNPCWNAAHVISHYGINGGLKDPSLLSLLFVSDDVTGITPVHVAAKNGRADFIKTIISTSSWTTAGFSARDAKNNSIYHFAAQSNKETIEVLAFCALGDLFNSVNEEGYTPLHVACQSDKPDCVKALIAAGANINMPSSFIGEDGGEGTDHRRTYSEGNVNTNRTSATLTGNVTSARQILTAYPNTFHNEEMKNGGTPLHWCLTKEVVVALVELADCCVDARNFCGQTALHVMVQRERFDCVVALLSRGGADPNLTDAIGNTPLHEVLTGSSGNSSTTLLIVQALISFGADVNILNNEFESPRHLAVQRSGSSASTILYALHAVGAKRCTQNNGKCTDGCNPTGKDDGHWPAGDQMIPRSRHLFDAMLKSVCQHSAQVNQPGKSPSTVGGRVLCLDGGGIRGLVLIQLLQSLEQYLGGPIVEYFDWISGTSTGGIIALAMASGKSVRECKKLYFRFKDQVFVGKRPYDADALEGFLRSEFGDKTMAELNSEPKVLVTAVSADTIPADLHFFRNYTSPQEMLSLPEFNGAGKGGNSNSGTQSKKAEEQPIWQAARASGAAPTYFRAFGSYLDGGLIANNPTLDVLTEIQEYGAVLNALGSSAPIKPIIVVSLGTGNKLAEQVDTLDLFRPESLLDTARLAFGLSAFGKLLVEQVTSSDRRVVDRARSWCTMIGAAYYRLSPPLTRDVALDETRNDQLIVMLWETQAYIYNHQADLKRIAQLLKC